METFHLKYYNHLWYSKLQQIIKEIAISTIFSTFFNVGMINEQASDSAYKNDTKIEKHIKQCQYLDDHG